MIYDQGGFLPPGTQRVKLTRGEVVMSAASLAALGQDMIEKLFPDSDVYTAEELLEDDGDASQ